MVDEVVCAETPEPFYAVGLWYDDFAQTTDDEVRDLLRARAAGGTDRQALGRRLSRHVPDRRAVDDRSGGGDPLRGATDDYDRCSSRIGDARFVLIGEASHGTHEFYRERARSRAADRERGFTRWRSRPTGPMPIASTATCAARRRSGRRAALADFQRFPRWMWRNADVLDFVDWLRDYNDSLPDARRGRLLRARSLQPARLDRGGARVSRQGRSRAAPRAPGSATPASITSATTPRPTATRRPRHRRPPARTRWSVSWSSCSGAPATSPGATAASPRTSSSSPSRTRAWQERRGVLPGHVPGPHSVWNLRDRHMAETLDALVAHLAARAREPAGSSSGRTTRTSATRAPRRWAREGELNLGQLVRERYGAGGVPDRVHAPMPAPSPRPPTGTSRRSDDGSVRAPEGATRRCSTRWAGEAATSCSTCATAARRRRPAKPGSSGRSA